MTPWTLAITGKGGAGKTTVSALAVRWLIEHGHGPTLAVDADPNICLDAALGVRVESAVGSVREEAKRIVDVEPTSTGGMGKQQLLDLRIQQSLVEADGFDLLAMGRPEGPGCYCYANNVLAGAIGRLAGSYPSVVIDNEAGLENLSRRIIRRVDHLLFVSDATVRGLTTARRLYELAVEMGIVAGSMHLLLNRVRTTAGASRGDHHDRAGRLFQDTPVRLLGGLPEDTELRDRDEVGEPLLTLPAGNAVSLAAADMFERLWQEKQQTRP